MKLIAVAVFLTASLSAQTASPAADQWKPFQFMIGAWEAKTQSGSSGAQASGTYTFQPELRSHVLARHSSYANCKGPADFDCQHGDLLYIYMDARHQSCKAIYFDSEGHVIHYDVTTPTPMSVVFLSEPSVPGPQFRLSYEFKAGIMFGRFQIRMPNQTEFRSYLEWSGEKKQ